MNEHDVEQSAGGSDDPLSSVDAASTPATGRRRRVLDELRAAGGPLSITDLAARSVVSNG